MVSVSFPISVPYTVHLSALMNGLVCNGKVSEPRAKYHTLANWSNEYINKATTGKRLKLCPLIVCTSAVKCMFPKMNTINVCGILDIFGELATVLKRNIGCVSNPIEPPT